MGSMTDQPAAAAPYPSTAGMPAIRATWRAGVLGGLRGRVLDIGAGAGNSLGFLRDSVSWVGLEPGRTAYRRLSERAGDRADRRVVRGRAERLPFEDGEFDAVISCATLCSVADQALALAEIRRVLRPGGRLVFHEHVLPGPGTWSRFAMRVVAPFSRVLDHGCDPARDTEAALRAAGFAALVIDSRPLQRSWPRLLIPHINGHAVR